ncbi:MAG: DUF2283 domain-containing protein [Chlorobiaceae bacterium]|nr:DUF2283 domain-containing protein [Chlorobiaceae bacterium]MBN2733130.1 DUF2283 domain-containing protein [Balneolaceae bacterium]
MKITYFKDTDTALIQLLDKPVFETREISDNVLIDVDEEGNLVSMTVEHAKEKAGSWEFSYQEITKKTV